jgi:hypothetical protein
MRVSLDACYVGDDDSPLAHEDWLCICSQRRMVPDHPDRLGSSARAVPKAAGVDRSGPHSRCRVQARREGARREGGRARDRRTLIAVAVAIGAAGGRRTARAHGCTVRDCAVYACKCASVRMCVHAVGGGKLG